MKILIEEKSFYKWLKSNALTQKCQLFVNDGSVFAGTSVAARRRGHHEKLENNFCRNLRGKPTKINHKPRLRLKKIQRKNPLLFDPTQEKFNSIQNPFKY